MNKFMAMSAAGAMMAFALVGCGNDEPESPETSDRAVTSTSSSEMSSSTKTTPKPTESTESSAPKAAPKITPVNDADYTPADGPNTRLFKLEDDKTRCFLNDLNGDSYLACETELADPPMVGDGTGNKVPANAVSWNPGGVTYEVLTFPEVAEMKTLPAHSSLSAYGFTCTAYGPSTLECSGPTGNATIDAGTVTGAQMPKEDAAPGADSQQGAPGEGGQGDAPADPGAPGLPGLPGEGGGLPTLDQLLPNLGQ